MNVEALREQIIVALCTDHGHVGRTGGLQCRTCQRRADVIMADPLAALIDELRRLRIEMDWAQGDASTERARRDRDQEKYAEVEQAWRELVEFNPDARTLGGPHSQRLWAALDALTGES